jgi:hypothetical protein
VDFRSLCSVSFVGDCLRWSLSRLLEEKRWHWFQCVISTMFSSQWCAWCVFCLPHQQGVCWSYPGHRFTWSSLFLINELKYLLSYFMKKTPILSERFAEWTKSCHVALWILTNVIHRFLLIPKG